MTLQYLTVEQIEASRIIQALYCQTRLCSICKRLHQECKGRMS